MCRIIVPICFIALHPLLHLGWRVIGSSDVCSHFRLFQIPVYTAIQCCIHLPGYCVPALVVLTQACCSSPGVETATTYTVSRSLNEDIFSLWGSVQQYFLDWAALRCPIERKNFTWVYLVTTGVRFFLTLLYHNWKGKAVLGDFDITVDRSSSCTTESLICILEAF